MANSKPRKTASGRRGSLVIDVHSHINVPEMDELSRRLPGAATAEHFVEARGQRSGSRLGARVPRASKPRLRLNDMDKDGADIHVVSINGSQPFYAADVKSAGKVARAGNEGVAEWVARHPDRFVGLGMVPFQAPKAAIRELEYAMGTLGLRGINILTNINGRELGDPRFEPFWTRAEALGATVLLHPLGFTQTQRLQKFFLSNTVGQPLEETLAMLSLIHEGVMERHPRLKVLVSHGGGYLPFYAGRSDSTFQLYPAMRGEAKRKPSDYIRKFYLDTCVFDRAMIEFLVGKYGANRIVLGTDYPYREWDALGMIRGSRALSGDAKEKILWKNAARLLNIKV